MGDVIVARNVISPVSRGIDKFLEELCVVCVNGVIVFALRINDLTESSALNYLFHLEIEDHRGEVLAEHIDSVRFLSGFDKLIESHTGIETYVADDAISCVAHGTGKSLEWVGEMQDGTLNISRNKQML